MALSETYTELLRRDFLTFAEKCFATAAPHAKYLHNWHIELIAEALEAMREGKKRRLIINLPPRMMKSILVSVAWPAWLLGCDPTRRILAASHAHSLAIKHALDTRLVMQSPWYMAVFPQTRLVRGESAREKFSTSRRGFRLATSVGAGLIGEGGGVLIADDPLSPAQACSESARRECVEWFERAFLTRMDDKRTASAVVVMQRLHPDDLSGYLLREKEGWEHLCLPAIAEERSFHWIGREVIRRAPGDALHEARENAETLARIRSEIGAMAFAAQYQQNPVRQEGGMIRRAWLRYADAGAIQAAREAGGRVVQSWDTAISALDSADWSVCATWVTMEEGYGLLDLWRERAEYPDLKRAFLRLYETWSPEAVLLEEKGSGHSLLQDLRRETRLPLIGVRPREDKATRLARVSPLFEAGRVWLPRRAPWLGELEAELLGFPAARHDDQVDAISQYLLWVRDRGGEGARIRRI